MPVTYTYDVFSSLDGFGGYDVTVPGADWGGYWGKQGPELLERRRELYEPDQRMVLGATTFRDFVAMLRGPEPADEDPWGLRMMELPTTVISSTLTEPVDWPDATVVSGDAVEVVSQLKETSDVPLRSHGSISLNLALMAAGLVDLVQVTVFPVLTGRAGLAPVFGGAEDFDLELVEQRTLDGRTVELVYRPTRH